MTEAERKALALVNEVSDGFHDVTSLYAIHTAKALRSALCRAIEQHEAFRQEVSEAITDLTYIQHQYTFARGEVLGHLEKFVLKEPVDPLVEALNDMKDGRAGPTTESYAACLRAAIEKRGGKIVWEDK